MSAIGGSLESIALDGRTFSVAADSDSERRLGGYMNEIEANGDGSGRLIKTISLPYLGGVNVSIDDGRGDHEFLQALANRKDLFPLTVTYASGLTYQGEGQLTGEITTNSQNTTATINVTGVGQFTKQ